MAKNSQKPNYRLKPSDDKNDISKPRIEAIVNLSKPNMEMHVEKPPTTGAPDVCTGNPLCYCVGVGNCSCDSVCGCDNVCTKDPTCPCVSDSCSCNPYCTCHVVCCHGLYFPDPCPCIITCLFTF